MPGFSVYSNELSIEEKIALAEYLWKKYGKDLAADSEIDRLLGLYRKEISRSYELMEKLGVGLVVMVVEVQVVLFILFQMIL